MLTGRYKFRKSWTGAVVLVVESRDAGGYGWRDAKENDLPALEPAVADGWRFPEERTGVLCHDGKRIR
jgi:hypothetical protein